MSTHVLIAEDHALLRQGLRALVEAVPDHSVVGVALSGREAVQMTLALKPDLLLLDLSLPDFGGVDVVAQIRRRQPLQKIIALDDSSGDIQASEALRAGCLGYLLKDTSFEEVSLAMKTVLAGRRFISQDVTDGLVGDLLDVPQQRTGRAAWNLLTGRERSVFKLIAQGKTNRSTAEYLMLSPKTIEKHRANLMRKLDLSSAIELTLFALDLGIVSRPGAKASPDRRRANALDATPMQAEEAFEGAQPGHFSS
jgi:DNA-binding NarL/FixJ family response regulator